MEVRREFIRNDDGYGSDKVTEQLYYWSVKENQISRCCKCDTRFSSFVIRHPASRAFLKLTREQAREALQNGVKSSMSPQPKFLGQSLRSNRFKAA